jgi:TrmH family RNA methyltransferase
LNASVRIKRITSRENPLIKEFRSLGREARARSDAGLSVIEGEHLCRAWLDHQLPIARAVVDETALDHPETSACVDAMLDRGASVVAIPTELMKGISTAETSVRLVCAISIRKPMIAVPVQCDCVLLDAVQDPGNVGAILRTAAAAGVCLVVAGAGTAGLWSPKVLRAGMGAHAALDLIECNALSDWIEAQANRIQGNCGAWVTMGTSPHASTDLFACNLQRTIAWVFGSEGNGMGAGTLRTVQELVRIDQSSGVESLNVAASVAVCLFEMRRQRAAAALVTSISSNASAEIAGLK